MRSILIVEDDALTRALVTRMVSSIAGVSVLATASVRETQAVLESMRPDAAIIDLHLGDGSGFEVLGLLDGKGGVSMAVLASAFLEEHQAELPAAALAARLQCLPKPLNYERLRWLIELWLPPGSLFYGPFAPAEYVQIAGLGRHSVRLRCFDAAGCALGTVVMHEGRVWSAEAVGLEGNAAFRELMLRSDAKVRVTPAHDSLGSANVDRDWQRVVLDALTLRNSRGPSLPSPSVQSMSSDFADFAPPSDDGVDRRLDVPRLIEEGVRASMSSDYLRAVQLLERALELDPDNISVQHQLRHLYQLQPLRKD